MFGSIGQHLLARWRLPPEHGGHVEADEGAVAVSSHVHIFYASVAEELRETPSHTVHIVLHGQLGTHSVVAELLHGSERGSESLLVGKLVEVEEHRRKLYPSFLHAALQTFYLFRRTSLQIFAHGPRHLTGPSELRRVRIVVGRVAIVKRIINVSQMLGQNLHLRACVSYIGVRVLHKIHLPMARRPHLNLAFCNHAVAVLHREHELRSLLHLRDADAETVVSIVQIYLLSSLTQRAHHRGRAFALHVYPHTTRLSGRLRLVNCRIYSRTHVRNLRPG